MWCKIFGYEHLYAGVSAHTISWVIACAWVNKLNSVHVDNWTSEFLINASNVLLEFQNNFDRVISYFNFNSKHHHKSKFVLKFVQRGTIFQFISTRICIKKLTFLSLILPNASRRMFLFLLGWIKLFFFW